MLVQSNMVCLIEWKDICDSLPLCSNKDRTKSQIYDSEIFDSTEFWIARM